MGGSGRRANRIRRPHKRNNVKLETVKFLNLNVQGWNWMRIDNFEKTRSILKLLRDTSTEVATLSEVHGADQEEPEVVYIEEFVFIIGRHSAVALGPRGRARWEVYVRGGVLPR